MSLLTVTQYAKQHGTSKQAVYDRIKRGTIKVSIVDNIQMIDTSDLKPTTSDTSNKTVDSKSMVFKEIKRAYKQIIKQQRKEIKRLESELKYCRDSKDSSYIKLESLFNKLYSTEQIIHDVKAKKKKK